VNCSSVFGHENRSWLLGDEPKLLEQRRFDVRKKKAIVAVSIVMGLLMAALGSLTVVAKTRPDSVGVMSIQSEVDGLRVTLSDGTGTLAVFKEQEQWSATATSIQLRDGTESGFTVSEHEELGRLFTVVEGQDKCLAYERELDDAAPTIDFESIAGEETVTVTPASQGCSRCETYHNTTLDFLTFTCSLPRPLSVCMHCVVVPCHDPIPWSEWEWIDNCSQYPSHPWCSWDFDQISDEIEIPNP
jgi:hypothetical protein